MPRIRRKFSCYCVYCCLSLLHFFRCDALFVKAFAHQNSNNRPQKLDVVVVGGGISGLVVGHVLSAANQAQNRYYYNVTLLESQPELGGHIRSHSDPNQSANVLNIGHATHMGMFVNLRLMLEYLQVKEWPVGRGPNEEPGLFRMLNVATTGERVQPSLKDILNLSIWWEAFRFYLASYRTPEISLDDYLFENSMVHSKTFLNILYWAMATFEFDKDKEEMGRYCLGAARALLITQVFFQYLLCDAFEGKLPEKIDSGLKKDLATRIPQEGRDMSVINDVVGHDNPPTIQELEDCFQNITDGAPLASYFSADYNDASDKLAKRIGCVRTNVAVTAVSRTAMDAGSPQIEIETSNGENFRADRIVFTTHPAIISQILDSGNFAEHQDALQAMDTGAVGVKIIQATDLPFPYPPLKGSPSMPFCIQEPPCTLGIFDISQLTRIKETGGSAMSTNGGKQDSNTPKAGWLSVAYPVYSDKTRNQHGQWLGDIPSVDTSIYPWTVATPSFAKSRRKIQALQGHDGVYVIGQALTGVNKASELQVTNALNLCHHHFGVNPPWRYSYLYPMLPDCNDNDAMREAGSPLEAVNLAFKSLVGSFVLTGVVQKLGPSFFD